eukprot:1146187-Pelagomonas_calceolata.AAC.2
MKIKTCVGRENSPDINQGKRDTLAQRKPSPEDERGINVDRVGFWQHAAPWHQCLDACFYSMARLTALHMLSGCQNNIISNMKTECHNVAGRMINKALSKSPWWAGLINTDIGSDDKLAQHNLQIPARASNRIILP